jgi:hypothetical protein
MYSLILYKRLSKCCAFQVLKGIYASAGRAKKKAYFNEHKITYSINNNYVKP